MTHQQAARTLRKLAKDLKWILPQINQDGSLTTPPDEQIIAILACTAYCRYGIEVKHGIWRPFVFDDYKAIEIAIRKAESSYRRTGMTMYSFLTDRFNYYRSLYNDYRIHWLKWFIEDCLDILENGRVALGKNYKA